MSISHQVLFYDTDQAKRLGPVLVNACRCLLARVSVWCGCVKSVYGCEELVSIHPFVVLTSTNCSVNTAWVVVLEIGCLSAELSRSVLQAAAP